MRPASSPFAFRSILCAIDFSKTSAAALRYAAALARDRGARLSVVFAVDPLLSAAAAAAYDSRRLAHTAKQDLKRFVRATLGPQAAGTVDVLVGIGKPSQTVLAIAEKIRADLVVAGTHGLTGIRKLFFGSTAEGLLRRSTLPVLVVPRTHGQSSTRAGRWPPRVLVLTLPRSGAFRRLLQGSEAYRFVHEARCPVLVLRVPPRPARGAADRPVKPPTKRHATDAVSTAASTARG